MPKTFCVGDVHGDLDRLSELLRESGLVSERLAWTGADSRLIFIGDLNDRGRQGIAVMRLVRRLQEEASGQGGMVESLLGNHDPLLLAVAGEIRGDRADPDCTYYFRLNGGKMYEAEELAADQALFEWVQARPLMARLDRILFQHADGMRYYRALAKGGGLAAVNEAAGLLTESARGAYAVFYDLTAERHWNESPNLLPAYLAEFGADRVIHGHTWHQGNEPLVYLNGLAVNVDNGMCWAYRQDPGRGLVLDLATLQPPA